MLRHLHVFGIVNCVDVLPIAEPTLGGGAEAHGLPTFLLNERINSA